MERNLRKTGIDIIGDARWGTHLCQFYKTKEDLIDILVPYFKAGLKNNEFCMWVTSKPLSTEEAKNALNKEVNNLDEYIAKGQIEILDYSQWYTKSGRFNAEDVLQGWVEKEKKALAAGFDGLRLAGNTFWLEQKDWQDFADYEAEINRVIGNYRMLAICTYSLDRCAPSQIIDVVSNHEFALIRREHHWDIIESARHTETVEALRESEEKFRLAFENAVDAIFWTDPETCLITNCNRAAEKLLERDKADIIGRHQSTLHPPQEQAYYRDLFAEHRSSDTVSASDAEVITESGKIKPVSITASTTTVGGKQIIQGIFRDTTERKEADRQLKSSELKLRTLIENAPIGIYVNDLEGRFIYGNEQAEKIIGRPKEEFIGRNFLDLDILGPEDVEKAKTLQRLNKEGKHTGPDEFTLNRKDGTQRTLEVSTAVIDFEGTKAVLGMVQDVTEHRRAEHGLRAEKEFTETALNAQTDTFFVLEPATGKAVRWNEAFKRVSGYSDDQIRSMKAPDSYYSEQDLQKARVATEKILNGEATSVELSLITSDGRSIPTEYTASLIRDGEGNPKYIIAIGRDITERTHAQEQVQSLAKFPSEDPNPVLRISSDGTVLYANEPSAPVLETWQCRVGERLPEACIERVYQAVNSHEILKFEFECTNGRIFFVTLAPSADGSYANAYGVDITERKAAEKELRIRNQINNIFLTCPDEHMYAKVLELVLEALESKYGTFGYFDSDGHFVVPAMTREIYWEKCNVPEKNVIFEKGRFSGIWGRAVQERKTLYSNTGPFNIPAGHIPIENTMVTPIIYKNELISAIHIANKPAGYDEEDKALLDMMADYIAPVLYARLQRDRHEAEREQAEQALRESQAALAEAQRIARIGNWEWDVQSGKVSWSDEVFRIFGVQPQEPSYEVVKALTHPDDTEYWERSVNDAVYGNKEFRIDYRAVRPDGSVVWIHNEAEIVRDESGNPLKMFGTAQDVTERKQAEQALGESEEKFRNLAEQSPNMIFINRGGRIAYANTRCEEATGYTRDEFHSPDFDFMTVIAPESRDAMKENYRRHLNGEDVAPVEYAILTKTGERIDAILTTKLIQYEGKDAILGTVTDITERKRAEEALQRSEANYRAIYDGANDGIFIHDTETGRILSVNRKACEMYGYTEQELTKLTVDDISAGVPPYTQQEALRRIKQAVQEGPQLFEWLCKDKAGRSFWIEVNLKVALIEGESRMLAIVRDITERKQADEALQLHDLRLEALLQLNKMTEASGQDILDFVREKIIKVTQSQFAFVGFLNEEESVVTMDNWSRETMAQCAVADKPIHYPVAEAGLWGEAVRQRKAVIVNDYDAPNPAKKGYPEGHVPVKRFMGIPVFEGERIVAVAAVANKQKDYDEADVRAITSMMNDAWQLILRKQAAETLRESEQKYRTLLKNIPQKIFYKDLNSAYVLCNDSFAEDLKIKPEEIKGKTDYDFFPKELADKYTTDDSRILESGNAEEIEEKYLKHGEDSTVHTLKAPLRDEQGNTIGIFGIFWDITDRKQAEEALKRSEERYALAQQAANVGSWDWNITTGELTWSEQIEPMFGFDKGQFAGTYEAFLECVHPDDRQYLVDSVNACVEAEQDYAIEHRIVWPDGSIREERLLLGSSILEIINQKVKGQDIIRRILQLVKDFTNFDAVGIRLREEDDYPYFEVNGFSEDFVSRENYLCARDESGRTVSDSQGRPVLECMCGNVILGRTDPDVTFFTEGGSFWTNSTSTTAPPTCLRPLRKKND
ncbi:MAG: PAS domain S-box protein [Planctomycetota bacterium]|jgi:PAS domain S-box-containing protein